MLQSVQVCSCIQAEPVLFANTYNGDMSGAVKTMALSSSCAGLAEFLLNPFVGKMSDAQGRRRFFLIGPTFNSIVSLLVVAFPTNLPLLFVARFMGNALNTVSGSVISATTLSDVSSGKKLAMNLAELWSYAGLGVIVGPFIGGKLMAATGSARSVYMLKAVLAMMQFAHAYTMIPETLATDDRKPFEASGVNPLAFTKLFQAGSPGESS